jgi:hypothetical protein
MLGKQVMRMREGRSWLRIVPGSGLTVRQLKNLPDKMKYVQYSVSCPFYSQITVIPISCNLLQVLSASQCMFFPQHDRTCFTPIKQVYLIFRPQYWKQEDERSDLNGGK